jgi:hypothetical protein
MESWEMSVTMQKMNSLAESLEAVFEGLFWRWWK